ncbi:SgcJ/EcaC family oxidoreductase [Paenibacillus solisilvae]|uniref:SgcJ/EcaC family oxidoreductase n=1 Tax=Paenibacillus solisilvae TaxID=2486751 RepID=A0ABW0VVB8_9BACL
MSQGNQSEAAVRELYLQLIGGWNDRNADIMSSAFAEDGELIGFDGSQLTGREFIASHVHGIFADHITPPFIYKIKSVRLLSSDTALLRAIVGMVPPGKSALDPKLNAHQTLVAVKQEEQWRAALFQNTPAQFHGRPDLVEQMSEELQA